MSSERARVINLLTKYVGGFPIPKHVRFKTEYSEQAIQYEPKDGDIILTAYPKTGSTWLLYVVWNIIHKCQNPLIDLADIQCFDTSGTDEIDAIPEPRLYKYHLPMDRICVSDKAKYIYVHRNPSDVLVSYYHFMKGVMGVEYDFDSFFDVFMESEIPYGNYFDHVLAAYKFKDHDNHLFLSYEDSKMDPLGEIMRIAKFLGGEYYQQFEEDKSLANKIMELTSFETMKKNVAMTDRSNDKEVYYFRKGAVGEGQTTMTKEQKKRLNDMINCKMSGTELLDMWLMKDA